MNYKRNDYREATTRLLFNAIKFRYYKLRRRNLKPTVVSLAVTNRCNSHCIMCNIWSSTDQIPDIKNLELSKQDMVNLLSKPIFSELVELDLTGGEPHLRDDLVDIVQAISRLKKGLLPKLRSIIITSNGFLTRRIISNYRDILHSLKVTDIDLISVTSIDGVGEIHDRIRGTREAFKLASETINRLLELKQEYPNLILGIKTTILPDNVAVLDDILNFALSNNLFHIISPVLFTEGRFKNLDNREEFKLDPDENKRVMAFYNHDGLSTSYFYSRMRDFMNKGQKRWVCTALYNYLYIDYNGQVYPCEIIPEPIGNIKKQELEDIWHSASARCWRKKIGKLECCRTCHEPGTIRYSAFPEGLSYFKFLLKLGSKKFNQSLHYEGISKYFNC